MGQPRMTPKGGRLGYMSKLKPDSSTTNFGLLIQLPLDTLPTVYGVDQIGKSAWT
jgi:hypothetical protein